MTDLPDYGTVVTTGFLSSELEQRLENTAGLPKLPLVAARVLELCREDDLDLKHVADTIALDPSLSVNVLHLVNSPAFGLRQVVRSTSHAIALLGLNAVRTLALSCSLVRDLWEAQTPGFQTSWKRPIVAAVAARELALTLRFPAPDEAFLAALLQDIGILALLRLSGGDYQALLDAAGDDHAQLQDLERGLVGADHGEIGGWLLGAWKLPGPLCLAVACSDGGGPDGAALEVHDDVRRLIRIVRLSGALADIWVHTDGAPAVAFALEQARAILGLGPEIIEPVLTRTAASIPGVAALFDLSYGTPEQIAATLERAHATLVVTTLHVARQVDWAHAAVDNLHAKTRPIEDVADRDALTALYNSAKLESYVKEELAEARRSGKSLSVVFAAVDGSDPTVDGVGRPTADQVLVGVGRALGGNLRSRDLVARSGGEEFALVLPETDAAGARVVAERIRKKIEGAKLGSGGGSVSAVTVSFGCATFGATPFVTSAELIAAARRALQAAKRAGCNRVESDDASEAPPPLARAAPNAT